jgi:hypothetical protein
VLLPHAADLFRVTVAPCGLMAVALRHCGRCDRGWEGGHFRDGSPRMVRGPVGGLVHQLEGMSAASVEIPGGTLVLGSPARLAPRRYSSGAASSR